MEATKRQTPDTLTCAYCGTVKNEISFFIGATKKPDWCMIEGTGKITCPDCYTKASLEGQAAVDRHITWVNSKA